MTVKSFLACEKKAASKLKNVQLPHRFKRIGIVLTVLSFLMLFVNKLTVDLIEYRSIAKYGLLMGMLVISISKAQIEDEFIIKMRMESYTFAFVMGIAYVLLLPFSIIW